MNLSRRQIMGLAAIAAAPAGLAGCGFTGGSSGSEASGGDSLTFTTWGTDAELAGLKSAISGFEAANDGVTVKLNAVPYE